ncbi:hypothetical protein [Candidatus Enterovibrio escicola]|uniref:hypothetical protein n=1 Tax=Candidatus Enterovibrio escicola TaxID=1927127 RepID=UPI0030DAE400
MDKANKLCYIKKIPNKQAGTEIVSHEEVAEINDTDFYFARSYRSSDRGLNEHYNGLIRYFYPRELVLTRSIMREWSK